MYELCNAQGGVLEFEDCGEHCHSWEFPHSGLDSGFHFVLGFFTCLQGAVLHWPNSNFIGVIYLGLLYRKIQQSPHFSFPLWLLAYQ